MMNFVLILGMIAAFAVFYVLVQASLRGIRWRRPGVKFLNTPIPLHWRDVVERRVPLAARLPDADRERLLRFVQLFLHEKRFESAGGLELTEEMKLVIAAQACLLVLNLDAGCYPDLKTVIVYPSTFVPKRTTQAGTVADGPTPVLGESWKDGVVVLAWKASSVGTANPKDGKNVILHEFAHQLDQEDGSGDGLPIYYAYSGLQTWARVLDSHFLKLKRDRKRFRRTVLNKYGATNKAEFFAVATEAFFEKGALLKIRRPELYAELQKFYRQDPVGPVPTPGGATE